MRYWIFNNNQVNGPYDPDDLSQLPSFSAESLVCPEGRKGTSMGDWQRAGMLPELSVSLLKATQLSTAGKPGSGGGSYASLPPEPTLRDLAALGSLQEKFSILEDTVTNLKEELRVKDTEISGLHVNLESRNQSNSELNEKLTGLEKKLETVQTLKETIDKALAAEKEVEGTVDSQKHSLEEIKSVVDGLKGAVDSLQGEVGKIDKIKEDLKELDRIQDKLQDELHEEIHKLESPKPMGDVPPPSGGPKETPPLTVTPVSDSPAAASPLTPPEGAAPAPASSPFSPPPDAAPAPASSPFAPPAGAASDIAGTPAGESPSSPPGLELPSSSDLAPAAKDAVAPPPEPPKSKSKTLVIAGVAILLVAVGGAYFAGLIPLGNSSEELTAAEPPLEPPAPPKIEPPPPPPEPTPEELSERAKDQALDWLKNWKPVGSNKSIGEALPASGPATGVSPWQVSDDGEGRYKITFLSASVSPGKRPRNYAFEVDMNASSVKGLNRRSRSLLKPRRPRRRVKIKPKIASAPSSMDALFDELDEPAPAAKKSPSRRSRKKRRGSQAPEADIDDLFAEIESDEPKVLPRSKPRRAAAKKSLKAKPAESMTLDDLLDMDDSPIEEPVAVPERFKTPSRRSAASKPITPPPAAKAQPSEPADDDDLLDDILNP